MAQGFLFPFSDDDCKLGRSFMKDPDQFLQERDMTYADIQCPAECHEEMERAEAFQVEADELGTVESAEDVANLDKLAQNHFGADYEVSYSPFGLRFKESILVAQDTPDTATASGSVTFLDSDTDTDS